MNILFTICGRAGSKGFKNKNLKIMRNIPLVYYTLSVIDLYAKKHAENKVIVALNTDSKELIKLLKCQNIIKDIKYVDRDETLADDITPKVAVIRDTYKKCGEVEFFDVVVDLDITSPMRRLCDIENAINVFMENKNYDVVFSVVPSRRSPYFNMVEFKEGYYGKVCESNYTARQQAPSVYELNASIYVYNPLFLQNRIKNTLLDYRCGISLMQDYLVLDIDSEEDFVLMEKILEIYEKKDNGIRQMIENCGRNEG